MTRGIIDFHTHAFPDEIAGRAMKNLEEEGDIKAQLDGTSTSLLSSMDACGIEKSIVCSIATKPSQFLSILTWCKKINSERILPFPSFHPEDTHFAERIHQIKQEGFKGIKFHPYYQDFNLDDESMFPVYEKICEANLIIVVHTGFDMAFPRIEKADPAKIVIVKTMFPDIKLVTTHLGSWEQWTEVEKLLVGKPIHMEISFSLESLEKERARSIILNHPKEYILFGTDSPWTDQKKTLLLLQKLDLGEEMERLILRENAANLLLSV